MVCFRFIEYSVFLHTQLHPQLAPVPNLGVLLMEYFELYGVTFDYDRVGISVRDGGSYFDRVSSNVGIVFVCMYVCVCV